MVVTSTKRKHSLGLLRPDVTTPTFEMIDEHTNQHRGSSSLRCSQCVSVKGPDETLQTITRALRSHCCKTFEPTKPVDASQGASAEIPTNRNLQDVELWPSCYEGQDSLNTLRIGIALTSKVWQMDSVDAKVQRVLEVVARASAVYEQQLNIKLVVGDIFLSPTNETWDNPLCQMKLVDQYRAFETW